MLKYLQRGAINMTTTNKAIWDGIKYIFNLSGAVKQIHPANNIGEVWLNGNIQFTPFRASSEDRVEYYPIIQKGLLNWELQVRFNGLSVAAKVKHELPGQYFLPEELPDVDDLYLPKLATWRDTLPAGRVVSPAGPDAPAAGQDMSPADDYWDEAKLNADLERLMIVHGRRQEAWEEIMAVRGVGEVVIASATPAVPSVNAILQDFVSVNPELARDGKQKIDYFASKIQIIKEGTVLARKVPGKPGVPGRDVFGRELQVAPLKDFQFRLKKNVHLSEDGLEVIATCSGQPVRVDERTYQVENVYVLYQDVDLATGSIEFPGDVLIQGNVQDGLRIHAGGKLEISGSASHANIKAEKGGVISQNLLGGKVVIGERFVVRSELFNLMSELLNQLRTCLYQTAELLKSPKAAGFKPEQCLKLVAERQFPELPKLATKLEKFVLEHTDDGLLTDEMVGHVRLAKHFLVGLGPLDPKSLPYLQGVSRALEEFVENISLEIPEKLSFAVNYVQGATVECAGSLRCIKGIYNSDIRVKGDVEVEGVCRGGKMSVEGNVKIYELGGSEVSSTFVQIGQKSRLHVDYCHSNAIISVGKELIHIEEDCRDLDVYRENGYVQVEKLKAEPV